MESKLLEQIGLENIDPAYFLLGLIIICLGLLVYIITVNKKITILTEKYKRFMSGKDGKSLEQTISRRFSQIDTVMLDNKEINEKIDEINEKMINVFQKIGIVKYDAFNEMGGKLSFAIALLDQENTGFVLNSMHSREGCYTYIKEIIKGESYVVLGEEEKEAVQKAIDYDNFMAWLDGSLEERCIIILERLVLEKDIKRI